ncbi:unnamed protein product [Peronospora belbahrii]|uniref:Thioredoxin domain-containing protein n=1 Tax=Peronospora belbahrii TaxID=622444 RepID=A0ABN8CLA3_9STRA|nr:unnamed protein product [Peronospora belbahrii]
MTKTEGQKTHEASSLWSFNLMRFMQITLGVTMFLSMLYMWQFIADTAVSPSKDAAAKLAQAAETSTLVVHRDRPRGHTQYVVRGFEEAHKFVSGYDVKTQGPLFLLFMSDTDANGVYWFPPCEQVKRAVYTGFQRAPRGSRLMEIQVGSEKYWNDLMNPFRQNQLFYIDYMPTLLRYDGGGNSSALLAGPNCLNQDLLDTVFRVSKLMAGATHKNRVMHMSSTTQVMNFLASYDYSYPLFLFFVSGVHAFNNRLWCPFCDKGDVPVMHYYNNTAPENAVMLRIVVAREPRQWFDEDNDFVGPEFSEKVVEFDGVPYLGFVDKNESNNKVKVREFLGELDQHKRLQDFFRQKAPGLTVVPAI